MKIELFSVPEDKNSELIKEFFNKNNIKFNEIITADIKVLRNVVQGYLPNKISLIRIKKNHNIQVIDGYNEHLLNQLLEHINKYNPKIE